MHDIAQAAAEAAQVPDFGDVLDRGRRRRNLRHGVTGGVAGLAVATVLGAMQVLGGPNGSPEPGPVEIPTPTYPTEVTDPAGDPERIVADPNARLSDVAIDPDNPGVALALWDCDRACDGVSGRAAVVTRDGFRTASTAMLVGRNAWATSLGDDSFLVQRSGGLGEVIDADGVRRSVTETTRAGNGGYPVLVWKGAFRHLYVIDPATAEGRRIEMSQAHQTLRMGDGTIAVLGDLGVQVSRDGGATWSEPVGLEWDSASGPIFQLVPSADPDTIAVLEGSDGATLFPFIAAHRIGESDERIAQDSSPRAYVSGSVVLADGRLLVHLDGWSDGDRPTGYYLSEPGDWSSFTYLDGPPGTDGGRGEGYPYDLQVTDGRVTIVAAGDPAGEVPAWLSTDGGESWDEFAAR